MTERHKREIRLHKQRAVHAAGLFGWLKKEWNKAGHTTLGNLVEGGLKDAATDAASAAVLA